MDQHLSRPLSRGCQPHLLDQPHRGVWSAAQPLGPSILQHACNLLHGWRRCERLRRPPCHGLSGLPGKGTSSLSPSSPWQRCLALVPLCLALQQSRFLPEFGACFMMAWYVLGHTKGAPRLILGSLAHVITWQCWRLVSLLSHSLRVCVLHTSCFLRQSIPAVKACLQKTSCSSSTKVAELCMLEYACWQHPGRLRAGGLVTCPSECCTVQHLQKAAFSPCFALSLVRPAAGAPVGRV